MPDIIEQDQGEEKAGWLDFGYPTAEIKCDAKLEIRSFKPVAGQAVLFPSYFFHGTRPFKSEQPRISMGIDLAPMR